jgi:hypothetical protein
MTLRVSLVFGCAAALLLPLCHPFAARSQTATFMQTLTAAKKMEAQGRYAVAGGMYFSLAEESAPPVGPVPSELKRALARRGMACVVAETRRKTAINRNVYDEANYTEVMLSYEKMRKFEPGNSTWPYLIATTFAAQGRYVEAQHNLKVAASLQGAGTEPAKRLLTAIAPYAKKDLAHLEAMDRAAMQAAFKAAIMTRGQITKVDPGYGDSAAGGRAQAAGDYGAASRFGSGTATPGDKAKYGGN